MGPGKPAQALRGVAMINARHAASARERALFAEYSDLCTRYTKAALQGRPVDSLAHRKARAAQRWQEARIRLRRIMSKSPDILTPAQAPMMPEPEWDLQLVPDNVSRRCSNIQPVQGSLEIAGDEGGLFL